MEIITGSGSYTAPPDGSPTYFAQHLWVPDLSVGTYSIPAGGTDDQTPHSEDEVYVVTAGRARLVADSGTADVGPDSAEVTVALTPEEADALAELLGTHRVVERLATLERQVEGLVTEQIVIAPGSPYDGRTLGDTQARTRTGASIVAVVRDKRVVASPRPDFGFQAGDVVVVVGTADGTAAVVDIFGNG